MKILISKKAKGICCKFFRMLQHEIKLLPKPSSKRSTRSLSNFLVFRLLDENEVLSRWGLRSIVVRTHLIFYKIERDRMTIVRVIDGRMDVDEEFQR